MQRTPNLGLPQFEPSDKYRLEDYNEAYMKIDEKVKELKDKEAQLDTKLAEAQSIIDTWTQFKNNGGKINGGIQAHALKNIYTLTSGEKERCYYFGSLNNFDTTIGMEILDKKSGFDTKVELAQSGNPTLGGQGYFGSSHDLITNLGSDNKRWKDVWVGSYLQNANGYTKLPNGMIMQWGEITSTGINSGATIYPQFTFPMSFPTKALIVIPIVKNTVKDDGSLTALDVEIRRMVINSKSAFQVYIKANEYISGGVTIQYIAIGY